MENDKYINNHDFLKIVYLYMNKTKVVTMFFNVV